MTKIAGADVVGAIRDWAKGLFYQIPSGGIPKTDLASAVQTSLGKADTALQSHQDISGKANKSEMSITNGTGTATIQLKTGTSATVLTEHQDISGKADKPVATTVTIATSDWSSLSCTKNVTGMTASKIVLVSPAPASFSVYTDAGVRCSAQGSGTLSFACDSVPSSSVTVNIIMIDAIIVSSVTLSSLTVSGSWTNEQHAGEAPDITGLSFRAVFNDGSTSSISSSDISVSPSTWRYPAGTQTATFSYTYNGVTKTATKTATVYDVGNIG